MNYFKFLLSSLIILALLFGCVDDPEPFTQIHLYNSTNAPIYVYHQFVHNGDSVSVQGINRIDTIKPYRYPLLVSLPDYLLYIENLHIRVYDEDTYEQYGLEGIQENNIKTKIYHIISGIEINTHARVLEYNGETIK